MLAGRCNTSGLINRALVPGCAELAPVEAMTALALRHVPRG
jgi:hypothetical protein